MARRKARTRTKEERRVRRTRIAATSTLVGAGLAGSFLLGKNAGAKIAIKNAPRGTSVPSVSVPSFGKKKRGVSSRRKKRNNSRNSSPKNIPQRTNPIKPKEKFEIPKVNNKIPPRLSPFYRRAAALNRLTDKQRNRLTNRFGFDLKSQRFGNRVSGSSKRKGTKILKRLGRFKMLGSAIATF